jgi:hypothetical protein
MHREPRTRIRSKHAIRRERENTKNRARASGHFLGIDGEGQGRERHKYVLLACADEEGEFQDYVEDENGLGTIPCLEFILNLPQSSRIFAFAFGYDLTKILKDLNNEKLYYLFRPELRRRSKKWAHLGPRPILWEGYKLNIQGTKFSVSDGERHAVIWDIWKFYQSRFTKALKLWKVGDPEEVKRIEHMKDQRKDFDKLSKNEVRAYCISECRYMGGLARKLVQAHRDAQIPLKSFYGAGSSAGGMLTVMGIKEKIREIPLEMRKAVSAAFFGGRFEHSVVGEVNGLVYNHDISSAYPYQLCFLPCLIHGTWRHTTRRRDLEKCETALVKYGLPPVHKEQSWGPFPFREPSGSICFPESSGGGWIWKDEYIVGERIFNNVRFLEAWTLHSDCGCRPFLTIPKYYIERLKLGKEGPGIVIKLGTNSVYGKLAQGVGRGVFNSWAWAGLVTSGCRAQILELLELHKDPANLLMIATDGVYTKEKIRMPDPRDTGTFDAVNEKGERKPLGGWETKLHKDGLFAARPGIYFPLKADEETVEAIRARGLGKAVLLGNMDAIREAWRTRDSDEQTFTLANLTRFVGAKTAISREGEHFNRSLVYGEWVGRPTKLSFNPKPKRERILPDGRLQIKRISQELTSKPYRKALRGKEGDDLKALEMVIEEQPDLGFERDY